MIEQIPDRPEGTLEFHLHGRVSGDDYDRVLIPAIERALEEHDRLRILCQLGPDLESFGLDAAWDDAQLGLRHWNAFERVALVGDAAWQRMAARIVPRVVDGEGRFFDSSAYADAEAWIVNPS